MRRSVSSQTVAFIDLGTNSSRMMLVRIHSDLSYQIISERKEVIRLGEDEFTTSFLKQAAMDRAILVLKEFVNMAKSRSVDRIIAVATSATREARNQREFLARIRSETGLKVRVISGQEEARLIYLGVVRDINLDDQTVLIVDIGGGSTEIIIGDKQRHLLLRSLPLGAIRLASLFPANDDGLYSDEVYSKMTSYVQDTAVRVLQELENHWCSEIDLMVGSSGTIENLADITVEHFFKHTRAANDLLQFDQLTDVIRMLRQTPLVERVNVPGINPERADIIVPGAAILDVLMRSLQQQALRISDRGLRDGLLFDYLLGLRSRDKAERMSFRKESVMRLGRAVGFEETHAEHVARLALRLFDNGKETQLHDLGEWERELLEYAALLHDIGISLSYDGHHRHSYYFIKHSELLGFNEQEVDIIATTTRYHRKAIPRKKHNEFGSLDPRSQEIVRILSVFLSIAESLDRSHAQLVENIDFIRTGNRSIILSIKARKACPLEEWGVDYHRESFEWIFNQSLTVEVKF